MQVRIDLNHFVSQYLLYATGINTSAEKKGDRWKQVGSASMRWTPWSIHSLSQAARNRSASRSIRYLYDNLKFIIVCITLPLASIFNSVTQPTSAPVDIRGGTTLKSASTPYNWSRHFRVSNCNLVRMSHSSNACHLPHPSSPPVWPLEQASS
jgi:hypothetical protein